MKLLLTLLMILPACSKSNNHFPPYIPVSAIDRELSKKHKYKYELTFRSYRNYDKNFMFEDQKSISGGLDMLDAWDKFIQSGAYIFKWESEYIIPKNYHYITLRAL